MPLGARRVGWIGIATTVAVLIVALGVVNTIYRSTGDTMIALLLMGIAVALPLVVAGLLHAPVRFSIVAALATVDEAEFALVRDAVEVSDSVLSKQVSTLEAAGYVKVRKGYVGKRPRTWLSLTRRGRTAYGKHLAALREIAGA